MAAGSMQAPTCAACSEAWTWGKIEKSHGVLVGDEGVTSLLSSFSVGTDAGMAVKDALRYRKGRRDLLAASLARASGTCVAQVAIYTRLAPNPKLSTGEVELGKVKQLDDRLGTHDKHVAAVCAIGSSPGWTTDAIHASGSTGARLCLTVDVESAGDGVSAVTSISAVASGPSVAPHAAISALGDHPNFEVASVVGILKGDLADHQEQVG